MSSRIRFAALAMGLGLSTTVLWTGCNESRKITEQQAGQLRDLRSTLNLEIQSVNVPESGNPTITFRATDADGNPIDNFVDQAWEGGRTLGQGEQRTAPYISAPRFVISQLQDTGDYLDLFQRNVTGDPWQPTQGGDTLQPALATATQANYDQPPTSATTTKDQFQARFTSQGNGVYTYQAGAPQVTEGIDRSKTFTAAMWATRTTPDQGIGGAATTRASPAHATFNFVPAGGTAGRYEVVNDAACNACHGQLSAHDNRTGVQLCITCHSPQSTDPETGNTVDFKVMVHKIHHGETLPSTENGTPYRIVGFAAGHQTGQTYPPSSVQDYSDVGFPRPIQNCQACHNLGNGGAANAENYRTKPSLAACTSCHDQVRFEGTGLPACNTVDPPTACLHIGVGSIDLTNCAQCHTPSFIDGSHQVAGYAEGAAFKYEIVKVEIPADRKPVVTFRISNPTNGSPYDLQNHPAWNQTTSGASRLHISIGYPSNEFQNEGGGDYGQPIDIAVVDRPGLGAGLELLDGGNYRITSPTALPANVQSATVMIDGHPAIPQGQTNAGTRIIVPTATQTVAVDGAVQNRREIVSLARCDACHGLLTAHGNNRNDNVLACAVCHNPNGTDKSRRPTGTAGETQIDFKWMVHVIHASEIRQNPVTIYGFGGSQNQFPLGFPGNIGDCNTCHVNDSWRVPLNDVVLGTTTDSGADPKAGGDNTRDPPTLSACLSCHDSQQASDHAHTYVQNGVETCATCHSDGGLADVSQVHPIRARDDSGATAQ